jgi:uncharacterized membrane protein
MDEDGSPVVRRAERSSLFVGALPSPAILAKYNEVEPGFAERVAKMAEDEAAHRRTTEQARLATAGTCSRGGRSEST